MRKRMSEFKKAEEEVKKFRKKKEIMKKIAFQFICKSDETDKKKKINRQYVAL